MYNYKKIIKKIVILLLLIISSFSISYAQEDSTKIAFVSYWSIGDSYDFKITKIRQQWEAGKEIKNNKQEYIAHFTVIDSTDSSYTIKWFYESEYKHLFDTDKIPENLYEWFAKYKFIEVIYKTSEVGDFIEVINWKEISNLMNNLFDDLVVLLSKDDKEMLASYKKSMQPIKDIYNSKQGIERMALKELGIFHFPMGLEFNVQDTLFYNEELPNLFGGAPIKANAKLFFENIDYENEFCTFKQEMDLDPNDVLRIIKQLFMNVDIDTAEMEKTLNSAVYEVKDRNVFEYHYNPGIPHRIETTREMNIDIGKEKSKRIDRIIIELIYDE